MRRVLTVLATVASCLTVAPVAALAGVPCSATVNVQIFDNGFDPQNVTRPMQTGLGGFTVCWTNVGGETHTASSNVVGLFDTGDVAPAGQATETLAGAGSYGYHCVHHQLMVGAVKVRPLADDTTVTAGTTVTLTVGDAALKGYTWDVQRRRNDGEWVTIRNATFDPTPTVRPNRAGTFRYRARTRSPLDLVSGWSPPRKVVVTAA
jgi:plastocyanin